MQRLVRKGTAKYGLPPGALIHVGDRRMEEARITVVAYDEAQVHETVLRTIDRLEVSKESTTVTWINVDGLHDIGVLEGLGARLELHPLVLEDILHTDQRPKLEDYGAYVYVVLKALYQGFDSRKAWKVATFTAFELSKTMYGSTGVSGSWRWMMSNCSAFNNSLTAL